MSYRDYDLLRLKSFMSPLHRRVLTFYVHQEPFRKNRAKTKRKQLTNEFTKSLRSEMARKKISRFRTEIAVDFHFTSSDKTHPNHLYLIKNYIDIIRDELLDDDRQVSVIESYHARPNKGFQPDQGSLRVTITPMGIYESKHALLQQYTDPNKRSLSQRISSLDDSPEELIGIYKGTGNNPSEEMAHFIGRLEEERGMGYLWAYDFPFNFSTKLWADMGMNGLMEKWRSEQKGILVDIPYTDQAIVQSTQEFLKQRKVTTITTHPTIDVNLEVINWNIESVSKDIDNILIDIKRAYLASGIFEGDFGGLRIYRYEDKLDLKPRLRIKLLPPMEVFFHIHGIVDQAKEKFDESD